MEHTNNQTEISWAF